ncbi:uncharacterized protein METZ01_LOCUS349183, partial [marine metagenome]
MTNWLISLLFAGIILSQDDGRPPNFVYLEPIEDFVAQSSIFIEIIVTDRDEIEKVALYYRFPDEEGFTQREMEVSYQPVIYEIEIPPNDVGSGSIQYYFWAKDIYGNEATWPEGGEDLPVILPVYPMIKKEKKQKRAPPKIIEGFEPPDELEDNLPYYLEVGMLAPPPVINQGEGIPIIVLSIYDPEEYANLESVKLIIDGKVVSSFNSTDMITFIPTKVFDPGYHIVRYEAENISGELLVKDISFFIEESLVEEEEKKV